MLIVCPTCATPYMVDQATLGAAGRTVRCARCKTAWFAGGPEPEPAAAEAVAAEAAPEAIRPARSGTAARIEPAPDEAEPSLPVSGPASTADAAPADAEMADAETADAETPPAVEPSVVPGGPAQAAAPPAAAIDAASPTVADAPPLAPLNDDDAQRKAAEAESEAESFATRRRVLQARRKKSRQSSRWTAVILLLVAINVAVIGARNEVVRYLPQTASLFAAIGLPVNLRNLKFVNVKLATDDADGIAMLNVTGAIVSESARPVGVPRLRFAVRNAHGQDVYTWTMAPPRSILEPGDRMPFHSQIPVPKVDAADVMVRFLTPQDAGAK